MEAPQGLQNRGGGARCPQPPGEPAPARGAQLPWQLTAARASLHCAQPAPLSVYEAPSPGALLDAPRILPPGTRKGQCESILPISTLPITGKGQGGTRKRKGNKQENPAHILLVCPAVSVYQRAWNTVI